MLNLLTTVLAEDIDLTKVGTNYDDLTTITAARLISGGIKWSLVAASVIFFFVLVIGGIKWILAGSDKGQTEAARGQITAALVGLVIVFSAWAIAQLIEAFFGVSIFKLQIPSA